MSGASPREFIEAMAGLATGVTVVTVGDGRDDVGSTVSAFASLSAEPPIVMVGLSRDSYLTEATARAGRFAVSVLGSDHRAIAGRFGAEGRPSARLLLAGVPHYRGAHSGALVLSTALAVFECAVREALPVGDHTVFLADVLGLGGMEARPADAQPLVRFRGRYRGLAR